jgi:glycosyltransferase involved in cell wall biosynthesis
LYLTPVMPAFTGNGLAMRCGIVLEALAAKHRVSMVVIPHYLGLTREIPREFRRCCERAVVLDSPPRATSGLAARICRRRHTRDVDVTGVFTGTDFDIVHVFRLAMLPAARRWLASRSRRPRLHLDLDDIESQTHLRIARLCRANGDLALERNELYQAEQFQAAEQQSFASVDRIYVCSTKDAALILPRPGLEIVVLPNGIRPMPTLSPAVRTPPYLFLFVGTLGYYPNEDAALFLCREVVPRLRAASAHPIELQILGGGASVRLRQAAVDAGVTLMGAMPSLRSSYERATAVLVPIRAGGGTRIKILEAFSYGRPVVSSRLGAEGIDAADGREILFAETPDDFATACVRLIEETDLSERLSTHALRLAFERYSLRAIQQALDAIPPVVSWTD